MESLLLEYKKELNNIKNRAKDVNISDKELNEIIERCFKVLKNDVNTDTVSKNKFPKYLFKLIKVFTCVLVFILFIYVVLNVHQTTSSIVLRNVQGLIYPGLKVVRFFAVPIIERFPSLTELYDETCLIENPYFYVSDMECWPCENIYSVIDLTGFNNYSLYQSGIPYIVKTNQKPMLYEDLQRMYEENRETFDKDSNSVYSVNGSLSVQELFSTSKFDSVKNHYSWRINRMAPGQIVRKSFPRPYIISEWSGQSTERFILIDGSNSSAYSLPNPECSYVFVIQGSGYRTIVLKPAKECGHSCKTVSVLLKPSFVLWYNWWYWRPISLPMENSTVASVSYLSSYC